MKTLNLLQRVWTIGMLAFIAFNDKQGYLRNAVRTIVFCGFLTDFWNYVANEEGSFLGRLVYYFHHGDLQDAVYNYYGHYVEPFYSPYTSQAWRQ